MYTKREAAEKLGIDRNTLAKWARDSGIATATDPRDARVHLLSDEDLRIIRERYADMHTFGTQSANRPQTASASSADLAARVAALEATIEQLRERAGWLFESRSAGNLATVERLPAYVPPKRQITATVRYKPNPALPPVPAHLMTIPRWCEQHDRSPKTVWHWMRVHKLPIVRGQWMEGMTRFEVALDIEGRAIAHQLAGIPWPCEICATVEDNETPHPSDE